MNRHILAKILWGAVAFMAIGSSSPVSAQETAPPPPTDSSFSLQLYEPAVGHDPLLTIESIRAGGHLSVTAGLWLGYAHNPFAIYRCREGTWDEQAETCELNRDTPFANVISSQLQADVFATLSFIDMIQIGLAVPVVLYQGGEGVPEEDGDGQFSAPGELPNSTSLGDIRLHLKWTAPFGLGAGEEEGFGLAIAPMVSFPTGNAIAGDSFMGDRLPTVHAQVLGEYRWRQLQVGARVGYRWRETSEIFSTSVGQQLTYAVGASWRIPFRRAGYAVRPVVEIFGANGFSTELEANPLELDVGAHLTLAHDFNVTIGAGVGLIAAVGVPQARVFAGFLWAPQRGDNDRDGVPNRDDQCPTEGEDIDGYEDSDGCPEPDNDNDGFPDGDDRCPDDAEDRDEFQDDDGCPELDNDGDGVNDGYDTCPDEAEDFDGYEDSDGCPDLDHDGDNIPEPTDHCPYEQEDTDGFGDRDGCPESDYDADGLGDDEGDYCPEAPEDLDGFEDDDGCPEPDNDNDFVLDERDRCPSRPETYNDQLDEDGCPDGRPVVTLANDTFDFAADIAFDADEATFSGRAATIILSSLRNLLTAAGEVRVRIVSNNRDEALARRRGEAVQQWLTSHGIDESRLELQNGTDGSGVSFEVIIDEPEFDAPAGDAPEMEMEMGDEMEMDMSDGE